MNHLANNAAEYGAVSKNHLEAVLRYHALDAQRAHAHLAGTASIMLDRDFVADAGQPTRTQVERALECLDFSVPRARVRPAGRPSRPCGSHAPLHVPISP